MARDRDAEKHDGEREMRVEEVRGRIWGGGGEKGRYSLDYLVKLIDYAEGPMVEEIHCHHIKRQRGTW